MVTPREDIVCHLGLSYWALFVLFLVRCQMLVPNSICCIAFCAFDSSILFYRRFYVRLANICGVPNWEFFVESIGTRISMGTIVVRRSVVRAFLVCSGLWSVNLTSEIRFSKYLEWAILDSFHSLLEYNQPSLETFRLYWHKHAAGHTAFCQQYIRLW